MGLKGNWIGVLAAAAVIAAAVCVINSYNREREYDELRYRVEELEL